MIHLTNILMLAQTGIETEPDGAEPGAIPVELLWALAAVFLAIFILITTLRKVRRSQSKDTYSVHERVEKLRPRLNPVEAQINELMAELADLSRQINGQMDTRIAKLEILRDDAERAIARLEELLGRSESVDESDLSFRHDKNHSQNVTNPPEANVPAEGKGHWSNQPKNYIASDQQSRTILELAREGKSAIHIAQELDRPVGEIELILALNKK